MKTRSEHGGGVTGACCGQVDRSLVIEHGVLMRQIARLQRHGRDMPLASNQREAKLVAENLRLRAQLMLLRTSEFWGLGAATYLVNRPPGRPANPPEVERPATEAQAVICQTGCAGHAHPWLTEDGQCLRTGETCHLDKERAPQLTGRTST
ncbi:MAG: hypothetical protein KDF54_06540 [Hydrogenophaga sp.]|nr:hypothetical protein [Hydrogenophaga sp.]